MTEPNRRQFLAATTSALAAIMAGCQDDSGGESTPPSTATETAVPTADNYEERTREFIILLDQGEYEQAHERFTEEAADAIPLDRLRSAWEAQEDALGPFQSITEVSEGERNGNPAVEARLAYRNGQLRAIVVFDGDAIGGFLLRPVQAAWTPPEYANEEAVSERTISLSATDGCSLDGVLTIPDDASTGETPGVVLVHGQGPMDRDGTFGPNKVYKDLAWGLASEGVTVLRYDKRSFACDVDMANASIHDVVTKDALTAVERLRETDAVAPEDVVVAGHSIGATLAPDIARRDGSLAGIVMLAALHRSAHEAIVAQNEFIAERDGTVTDEEKSQLEQVRDLAERIRTLDIADDETAYLGGDEYWGSLQDYDHEATAQEIETPQLYLQGGRDWQVTVEADFRAWQDALEGKEAVAFERYDDLNHLFMPGSGPPSQAEYFEENHVDERVITDLVAFADRVTSE